MNCSACGAQLPAGVAYCPNCGTPTPAYYAPSGTAPNNPTMSSSSESIPPPYTNYGSQPYGTQSPYDAPPPPPNPYNTPAPPSYASSTIPQYTPPPVSPPPTAPKPSGNRTGLIIGLVALVLLLIVGGVFALVHAGSQGTATSVTPTVPPAQATGTAQAQASATAVAAVTATAQAQVSATAAVNAANPNPYTPGQGQLALKDPLTDNSQGYKWDVSNQSDGTCAFTGGSYHVSTTKTQFFFLCAAEATDFSNFAFEIQAKIVQGDCAGVVFRADTNNGKMYFYEVCQDGTYDFSRYLDYSGNNVKDLAGGSSAAIVTGLNQTNTLGIVAQGSTLTIYVNKQKITSVTDSSFTHGQFGVFADATNHPTEVAFNNAKVWTY
ncbi:MAG TPA: family 16 glycoside hydrolase [Ktedonobacteraceae bacterium]|nr:family 16 glycoside hydrolase [Ktedonobacteraceae bacterium]